MSVCVPDVPVKLIVPVPAVNVPLLVQSPVKLTAPVVTKRVPALLTVPDTLSTPLLTLRVEPEGTVTPCAKTGKVVKTVAAKVRQKT